MPQIIGDIDLKTVLSHPETPVDAAPAAGLVISAISGEADFAGLITAETLAFPSADFVGIAAGFFPPVVQTSGAVRWHSRIGGDSAEYFDNAEGSYPRIEIAPGLVRLARHDVNRSEKTRARLRDAALARAVRDSDAYRDELHKPMVWADFDQFEDGTEDAPGKRGIVAAWSAKSRARLISTICELDLSAIVAGGRMPCMVTLTLPGDWLAVAPDAATVATKFHNFVRAWEDKWGVFPLIWKREFQRRGAPHWHLWTVPPVPMAQMKDFRAWLSRTWTRCLGLVAPTRCTCHRLDDGKWRRCSEYCRHLAAGTGVDFAEGLRARDPKRLAVYFLKESLGGEGKAYQNGAPAEWAGQSIGRFWGYRRLDKAVASAPLEPVVAVSVGRAMRRWQRAQGITEIIRTLDGRSHETRVRVTREQLVQRVNTTTGELRLRRLRRPARVMGAAGWVAVNNGASLGGQLGLYASYLSERLEFERRMFATETRHVPADPPWLCTLPADHPAILSC